MMCSEITTCAPFPPPNTKHRSVHILAGMLSVACQLSSGRHGKEVSETTEQARRSPNARMAH